MTLAKTQVQSPFLKKNGSFKLQPVQKQSTKVINVTKHLCWKPKQEYSGIDSIHSRKNKNKKRIWMHWGGMGKKI